MIERLRAGVAVYNAGAYHAAHDAWEARWLELEEGTDDERLLHGLIQYTAAVHHATNRNWVGTVGLAESALAYLADLPADYRDVAVVRAREYLRLLAADPERIERASPWPLAYGGAVVRPADLTDAELAIAAETVAEDEGLDVELVERATERLQRDADRLQGEADRLRGADGADPSDQLRPLLVGLIERPDARGTILQRLEGHLDRDARKDADVSGLFEEE